MATDQRDVTGRRGGAHVKTRLTDGARAIKGSWESADSSVRTTHNTTGLNHRQSYDIPTFTRGIPTKYGMR